MIIRMKHGNDRYHFWPKMYMSPTSSIIISMCNDLCHELMLSCLFEQPINLEVDGLLKK